VIFGVVLLELGLLSGSWFQIVTHRSFCPKNSIDFAREDSHQKAMKAASQIVRIVEDLLSSKKIQQCPIHFVPALFAAMGMHAIDICSGDAVREQLGNCKIRLSMIALRELKSTWPVSKWVFLLFTKIIRQIRGQGDLSLQEEPSNAFRGQSRSGMTESVATNTDFNGLHGAHYVQTAANLPRHQESQICSPGPISWDLSDSFIPFSFPVNWNETVHDSLWSGQDLEFWMMAPTEGNGY
jgi:hypothetical protein